LSDFEVEPGLTFGEWLRRKVEEGAYVEKRDFFADQVARVAERLQADRPAEQHLEVVIPWFNVFKAFTGPGRYIYFSRRLLERCPDDDAVAFVIAHEIAHHDLGHLNFFEVWLHAELREWIWEYSSFCSFEHFRSGSTAQSASAMRISTA
jgi:hypothetical protein